MKRVLLVVGIAVFAMPCVLASSAIAGYNEFCPPYYPGTITINANDRCVSARFNTLTQVQSSLANGSGVSHCAVGKQYSDGSGHDVIDPGCSTAQTVYSACYISTAGYATQINRSNSAHKYFGFASYGSTCLT